MILLFGATSSRYADIDLFEQKGYINVTHLQEKGKETLEREREKKAASLEAKLDLELDGIPPPVSAV